jgi:hypothetical protein
MRMMLRGLLALAIACVPFAGARGQATREIPKDMVPPPGMCRIWLDSVPPSQQPAPTTCAQAVRTRPPNGRVIWGPQLSDEREPMIHSFTEPHRDTQPARAEPHLAPSRDAKPAAPKSEPSRREPAKKEPAPAHPSSPSRKPPR